MKKLTKFQKLLQQKSLEWQQNPELLEKESFDFFKKHAGKNMEAAEIFLPLCIASNDPYEANQVIVEQIRNDEKLKKLLYMYLETYSKFSDTPNEAIFVASLLNEVEDDKIELINLIIGLYTQIDEREKSMELFEAAKDKFPEHFNEVGIAQQYLFSEIPEYIEKGKKIVDGIDIEKIDRLNPLFINVGSLKFYSGNVYDGLIYHFGGEDFRPSDFTTKKEIPNHQKVDFNDKSVVITPYRGMGDSMILSRFIPKFLEKWPKVKLHIATEKPMIPLYQNVPGVHKVGTIESFAGKMFDYCLGVNMLSRYLRESLVDDSDKITYHEWIAYPESYDEKWKNYISKEKPIVGINWKGSQRLGGGGKTDKNITRDVPFEEFIGVIDLFPDYNFIVLNNDVDDKENEELSKRTNVSVPGKTLKDFGDTAALIKQCDVVVTIDTSISTLSASLSKDTIVMAKFWPDYRWLYHTKWWDLNKVNIDVFRKPTYKSSWATVLLQVCKKLQELRNDSFYMHK
jgi:ADP-heptose:LPS heptosyltransferase